MSSPALDDALDLDALRFEPLADRASKVALADLGRPSGPGLSLAGWVDRLPDQLAGKGLRRLRDAIVRAHAGGSTVAAALGGHVIKTGCGPYLIDWMDRGILGGLALNGSAAIHDLELAIAGRTSEDVGPRLMAGTFGFARETSDLFARACDRASDTRIGLGAALGDVVIEQGGPGLGSSVLAAARRAGIPLSVHVAIGTDIVHMTNQLDGAALGRATLDDFRNVTELIARMADGVWLNLGSAVVLPEVFLKAVAIVRNLGRSIDGLTTANLDFNQQYRGLLNVLQRPGAEGIALTGHHELMIPLLHASVLDAIAAGSGNS
ncbi:hypothetical protein TA3x_004592 [Tundrisphaera sp. TA3]|uniref:hypothetical protein n=1 Tax=Tundrisphaera sp. TA3 TaxID=3435775 RepID=UPI003EBF5B98